MTKIKMNKNSIEVTGIGANNFMTGMLNDKQIEKRVAELKNTDKSPWAQALRKEHKNRRA